jgi:hypothetical protein
MSIEAIAELEPLPIDIDPRPCEWCGLTIDQHIMVDDGEGPEFFCEESHPYAANLVLQWELQDPRDAWRHTGEVPPPVAFRNADSTGTIELTRQQYRTPQATVDAFFFVTRTKDADGIAEWLAGHPRDAQHLHKLWKQKCSTAAAK